MTMHGLLMAGLLIGHWTVRAAAKEPGYPNLIVNRAQIAAVRAKIKRAPYKALWGKVVRDAEQRGRRHVNAIIRNTYRWERAFEYAVTGNAAKIGDLRGHLLGLAARPVQPIKHFDWHLAEDAVVFDLLGASFSSGDQVHIRKHFAAKARAAMAFLKTYRGTQNMMTLQRFNVALLGYAARDREVIDWALNTAWGFKHAINWLDDGIWGEANAYAIHYVLPGWIAVAEAARNFDGADLWAYRSPDGDSLQTFLDRYLDMAWPIEQTGLGKGSVRIASYGDAATAMPMLNSPDDIYLMNVPAHNLRSPAGRVSLGAVLEVAYARLKNPRYAWLLSLNPGREQSHERAYLNHTALTHGLDLPVAPNPPPAPSRVWKKAGRAMLRADESPAYWTTGAPAAFLVMNRWYGHGHRDRLHLMFHANGRLLYPDLNVIQYEPPHVGWTTAGIGHNLVLVARQGPWGGPQTIRRVLSPEVKFVAVTADPTAQVNRFMEKLDVWETRALALTREYLLDLFWVDSKIPRDREFTWVLHGLGRLRSEDLGQFTRPVQPRLNHFKWIRDEQHWHTASNWSVEWVQQSGGIQRGVTPRTDAWFKAKPVGVRMTMLGTPGTEAHLGHGPLAFSVAHGINAHDPEGSMPLALARRNGRSAIFTVLHEPFVETSRRLKLRRVAEDKATVAVEISAAQFRDFAMADLGRIADQRGIGVTDRTDVQQVFRYRGFAWLRMANGHLTAHGGLKAFRVHAPGIKKATVNGKPVRLTRDAFGYVAWNQPPATTGQPTKREVPEWDLKKSGQPAVVLPSGSIVAPISLAASGGMTEPFRFVNLTDQPAAVRIHVEVPEGLRVPKIIDLGQVAAKEERSFDLRLEAGAGAPRGKPVSLRLIPETDGRRGRALVVPVTVGVCLVDSPRHNTLIVRAPHYTATLPKAFGVILNLTDPRGMRRSVVGEAGINHWGFPSAGNPWREDQRIFGLNGHTAGHGQTVKLIERTATSLTFERATRREKLPDRLHYRFAPGHIAMSIDSGPTDGPLEINVGAFERMMTERTTLHWSDGETTDFSPAAIGSTYHQYPPHRKPWKQPAWVAFRQSAPHDAYVILLEFPHAAQVQAGTHSQLYFNVKLKSGQWVKLHFLTVPDFAKWKRLGK